MLSVSVTFSPTWRRKSAVSLLLNPFLYRPDFIRFVFVGSDAVLVGSAVSADSSVSASSPMAVFCATAAVGSVSVGIRKIMPQPNRHMRIGIPATAASIRRSIDLSYSTNCANYFLPPGYYLAPGCSYDEGIITSFC